ncbi:MAG: tRNA (N6-isopentenyl adenosine(37)-C2)-methylthiotransferase MiaB [Clostridia bacterium]|nr:tRNA (N6-isopentenyl adenosine(37)-C2)-methylthiotransferase MiaB [Clostridia bacterium]
MNINISDTELFEYSKKVRELNGTEKKLAAVITLGCQQNEADSEKLRAMAVGMGYGLTDDPASADLIVVNTCAIREHAELKALSIVGSFKAYRKTRPDLIVGVCGCMAAEPHRAEQIKRSYHHVSFTLEPNLIHKFPELVYTALCRKKRSFVYNQDTGDLVEGLEAVRVSGHKAWVSIMYGCNNFCSYCIVPYVRGRERSRASADVIRECRELVAAGYKEITLLGQNVNSYKSDISFPRLLEEVASIPGDFIVRFMTSHPKDASDELIEVFGKYTGKIAPSFHLPLQSGSDAILKRMNRTYNTERYLGIVKKIRDAVPDGAITSDIIVGFPGETEEDFEGTMNILRTVRFDMVFSFNYSPREGTRAAAMEDRVSPEAVKARMARLLEEQGEISREKNDLCLGKELRIIVDGYEVCDDGRIYSGRDAKNKLVHFRSEEDHVGEFINVKIIKTGAFDLVGEIVR